MRFRLILLIITSNSLAMWQNECPAVKIAKHHTYQSIANSTLPYKQKENLFLAKLLQESNNNPQAALHEAVRQGFYFLLPMLESMADVKPAYTLHLLINELNDNDCSELLKEIPVDSSIDCFEILALDLLENLRGK